MPVSIVIRKTFSTNVYIITVVDTYTLINNKNTHKVQLMRSVVEITSELLWR